MERTEILKRIFFVVTFGATLAIVTLLYSLKHPAEADKYPREDRELVKTNP